MQHDLECYDGAFCQTISLLMVGGSHPVDDSMVGVEDPESFTGLMGTMIRDQTGGIGIHGKNLG